ncbi:hypothetical protein N657DRAFT_648893 [Parathielavia appendiculata]|uniref:Uncharacterized protein n=1 Tax=Parathielavia appendiculata TaxID=2587402 RepID=A0AAN6TTZ4_9PEZI|nr:hypothetical protein N657DRAFT_648893 [Parathielavia appendiculata]
MDQTKRSPGWYQDAIVIQDCLQEAGLSQWGFVIFRCTYRFQEKWDKFVTLAKGHVCEYFEKCRMESVYDRMRWTIIEDAAALEGAHIIETTRRFVEWVHRGPGREEMYGSVLTPSLNNHLRYTHFRTSRRRVWKVWWTMRRRVGGMGTFARLYMQIRSC